MAGALAYEPVVDEREQYELINGEVYMMPRPSINHARIAKKILGIFDRYLKGKRCEAFGEVDVHLGEKDNFIPDVIIVCNPDIIKYDAIYGTPDLVVEILSPSTALKDRTIKLATYAKYGVKEYWLVDPRGKSVEVYLLRDGVLLLDNVYFLHSERWLKAIGAEERAKAEAQKMIKVSLYDDFIIDVADVFEDVD